jgi:hypothetical protein
VEVDRSRWSGDGAFTETLLDALQQIAAIVFLRVEDAPASRAEAGYNFIANEVFVRFDRFLRRDRVRWLGFVPARRTVATKAMTLRGLESALAALEPIGPPDYADQGMIQYLRTERVVPPYQTRGYKLVELVRIYEIDGSPDRPGRADRTGEERSRG